MSGEEAKIQRHTERMPHDDRGKPENARDCWCYQKLGRDKEGSSPQGFGGSMALTIY